MPTFILHFFGARQTRARVIRPFFFNRFAAAQPVIATTVTEAQKALNKNIRELLAKLKSFIFNNVTVAMLYKRATQTNVLDPAKM